MVNGWVHEMYVEPKLFFPYYGFEWVSPIGEVGLYLVFIGLCISFTLQAIGLFYKAASVFSFVAFTYVELLDKTNYLNHYYFVSLILLLLIFVPANRFFSVDCKLNPSSRKDQIPRYFLLIFQLQIAIVYFYAGLAKLNADWIFEALPLKIWLPAKANVPVVGFLFEQEWIAYFFSWFGAFYDLFIPFFLFWRRSTYVAYFFVVAFHILTWVLFPIGVFPFVMIGATIIFFPQEFHLKVIEFFKYNLPKPIDNQKEKAGQQILLTFFTIFFIIQLAVPLRYLLYNNNLYWTEEGYRFSWRVMLMEKAGYAIFKVSDPITGRKWEVNNYNFLTPNQEKMMSTQPDMILQFAHYLDQYYQAKGIKNPIITADVFVTLNGRPSQLLIDPTIDLTNEYDSFAPKKWVLPLNEKQNIK